MDPSNNAVFDRYNFHSREDGEKAELFLRGAGATGDGPSVLLLSADGQGAGRRYFLDALAYRLRREELVVRCCHLDLAGFEPDRKNGLAALLRHQSEAAVEPAGRAAIEAALQRFAWPRTDLAALFLLLLLELEAPQDFLAELAEASPEVGLESLLRQLTAHQVLVLHLVDFAQVNLPARQRLVALAERLPRLFLAFSCWGEKAERVAPQARHPVLRIEIEPLTQDELRQDLEGRFAPNVFPPELSEAWWRQTGGAPALLGPRAAALVEQGVLQQVEGAWRLTEELAAERVQRILEGEPGVALEAIFAAHPEQAKALRSLLLYGALGGGVFPPKLLLELMRIEADEADELIDLIDEKLVEERGLIDDLEFRHPGFAGLQIYRFADPALAATILHKVGAETASAAARTLLEALAARLPPYTRAVGQLHLALARHLGPGYQKPHLDRQAWWTSPGEAGELEALVRQGVAAGELRFEEVWQVVKEQGKNWPPFRRLPLLVAVAPELAEACAHGAEVELAEAYAELLAHRGEHAKARQLQEAVLDAVRRQLGSEHPLTLNAMENLALSFFAEKEFSPARGLQDEVLEKRRQLLGEDHPETLTALWNLAVTMKQQGDGELAGKMLEKAAADLQRVFGESHPISRAVGRWLASSKT